ncbi:cache domain-containing protein [Sedimentitalea sp. HM32M-2]|uniref:cache domain-containing protein n=1 Tax=Sedimentitalea sp. HM32M-2 TaxID=3351566 RepID=UPI0036459DCB
MSRKLTQAILPVAAALTIGIAPMAQAAGGASPEEIVQKVREAAEMLAQDGGAGLDGLNNREGEFVWKDTYVFALNCSDKTVAAHPVQPELIGRSLTEIKDRKGNEFLVYMCLASKVPAGGWVEYWWPIPGMGADQAARKISYIQQVEGTPYQVAAGVYDARVSLWALNEATE